MLISVYVNKEKITAALCVEFGLENYRKSYYFVRTP